MNLGLGLSLANQKPSKLIKTADLTSSIPSWMTFSRASSATRFNSSGGLSTELTNVPRFDYDPLTLNPLGLLLEVERTNKIKYSSDFTNAVWLKGVGASAAGNTVVAPDGTTTADTLTLTSNSSSGYDMYQSTTGYTPGTTMVFEGWVKLGTATNFAVVMNNAVGWNTIGGQTFSAADGLSTTAWKKIKYSFTVPATGNLNLHIGRHGQTGQTQQTAGTVYVWGFRITAAEGSEIPTTSAIVTQSADVLTAALPDGVWDITTTDTEGSTTSRVSIYGGVWAFSPRSGKNHVTKIKCTLVRKYAVGTDTDALAWFSAQSITDEAIQTRYLRFTTLCKALTPTIWSRLMLVSCRDGEGYLYGYGGGISTQPSQLRGKFRETGTVTKSTTGAQITYAANWANRIETPLGFVYGTHRAEPVFIGMVYSNTIPGGAKFQNAAEFIHWNVGTTSGFITNYSGGDAQTGAWQTGVAINGANGGQYIIANALANNSVDAPQFIGVDFQDSRKSITQISNENYQTATHATASPSTSGITTGLYFYPCIKSTGGVTGKIQYLVYISSGVTDIPSEAKKFWDILRGTLISDIKTPIHFHQGGQSLSSGYLQRALQMQLNTDRTVTTTTHTYGGTYIQAWVGADPNAPVRSSQYLGGFYKGDGTGAAETYWPFSNPYIPKWMVWLQGESDTELRSTATVYQQQLQNLLTFLTADFGSDFKMAVNRCDYAIAYRTGSTQGDFTISGITGPSLNGTWSIAAVVATTSGGLVTNASTDYSWSKSGGGTITRDVSGYWNFKISGTTYAVSNETYDHPELCTYTLMNGASGTIAFSESRTGNIERVRKAQLDFAAANPTRVTTFDSRGVTRPVDTGGGDAVHPDNAGQDQLAIRAKTAMLTF